jgi:hypothetical protein
MATLRSVGGTAAVEAATQLPPASIEPIGPTTSPVETDVVTVPKRSAAPVIVGVTVAALMLGAAAAALVLARQRS